MEQDCQLRFRFVGLTLDGVQFEIYSCAPDAQSQLGSVTVKLPSLEGGESLDVMVASAAEHVRKGLVASLDEVIATRRG